MTSSRACSTHRRRSLGGFFESQFKTNLTTARIRMPAVSLREILQPAFAARYGVGAFNIVNDLSMAAVWACAAPGKAPVAWYANIQKWFVHVQGLEVWQQTEQMARAAAA